MLVVNLADDLFEQVFDGDEAGDAAVLVDDDAHMLLFALHLAQQFVDALGLGDELRLALDAGHGAGAGLGVGDLQQVVGEGDAGDVVDGAFDRPERGRSCARAALRGRLQE